MIKQTCLLIIHQAAGRAGIILAQHFFVYDAAESLLADPALFSPKRLTSSGTFSHLDGCMLLLEYIDLCEQYPTPWRMVKGHAFKLLGACPSGNRFWLPPSLVASHQILANRF